MDDKDKELMPVLARLVLLNPYNNHDPDVIWLYNWFTHPDRSVEEFHHVVGPLQAYVLDNLVRRARESWFDPNDDGTMDEFQNIVGLPQEDILYLIDILFFGSRNSCIYTLRTAAEALAARCPVLEGRWEQIAHNIFGFLGENLWVRNYGNASSHLSNWIIHVVGNPDMCPNMDLRYQILLLYRTMVKIDHGNYKQALESFMSICSFLGKPKQNYSTMAKTKNIVACLMLFKKKEYGDILFQCHWVNEEPRKGFLYKFGLTVANTLKNHRCLRQHIHLHDTSHYYSMGLKTITEPRELLSLTQLIRYISNVAHLEYLAFKDSGEYNIEKLLISSCGLVNLVRGFQTALQDPMLLSITAESIIDVMEAVLIVLHHAQGGVGWPGSHALVNVDVCLEELFNCKDDGEMEAGPIGWEIIKKYNSRICYIKSHITKEFLEDVNVASMIYAILYNNDF